MPKVPDEAKELRSLWGGFWSARVILTANNYRVFEHLKSPKAAHEVAEVLGTDARATEILLDALTGLRLLKKSSSKYRNSSLSSRLLISESPYYQGDIMRHADILWKNWSGLDDVIKTGKPHHVAHDHNSFILGMHNLAILKARGVIRAVGLRGVQRALDLGGGPGTYAMEMARKGVSVTLFDRPETVEIAKSVTKESGVSNIHFLRGDFLYDGIGNGYDLIFISQVLHSCSDNESMRVVEKSKNALNPGGRVVIQEFSLREDRALPPQSALFSVNMLVNTVAGRCYSSSEIRGWLSRAGLSDIREKMMDDTVLVSGRRKMGKRVRLPRRAAPRNDEETLSPGPRLSLRAKRSNLVFSRFKALSFFVDGR
jgi:2-polyprenyl-3-methyl-5-hydroxy-6-metoxy-1,4-benzoquinol methylase